jgi:acetyl esterase
VLSVPQALRPESCRQPPAPPRTPPHSKCHDRFRLSRPSDLSALDPALARTLQRFARLDADTPTPQLDYAGRRRLLSTLQAQLLRSPLPGMVRTDHFVPAQGREITVRSYQKGSAPSPQTLVWLHGGGWMVGDLNTHDDLCEHLAQFTGHTVLSVHYRRTPENPFPRRWTM